MSDPLKMVMAPSDVRSHDCHFCSFTATRFRPSMCAFASGKAGGRLMRMLIVCSSRMYEAVISRARGATRTANVSSVAVSAHVVTLSSAALMTGGEMDFSVQGSRVTAMARDLLVRALNQDFVRDGVWRSVR